MDTLTLARLQFGITTVYHFFFVPLTIGLSILVAIMQTAHVRTGAEKYKHMTKFWGKLLLINFAMGVVTGIVQEFQFGMNWSEYSRFVGDIFGAPLAVEALMAFFIESTFLGLWIFGEDKLSKPVHLLTIWLVALAANLSAFWILVANSFMQNPVGYHLAASGRAEMTDFFELIGNPNVWLQWPHVALGGLTTAGFFLAGVSAFRLVGKNKPGQDAREIFRMSLRFGLAVGTVAVLGTMIFGHLQGQRMEDTQPMKLASAEGLWDSESPASLSMFQIGNEAERTSVINIRIPSLLSLLTYNTPGGQVEGVNQLQQLYEQKYGPGDYAPPAIWLTYWSFRAMVGAGALMFVLGLVVLWLGRGRQFIAARWLLWALVGSTGLPYLANSTGWILTEVGRQPWIVFGLMRVDQGLSPNVGVVELLITVIGFTLIYGALMVADVYLLAKFARVEPGAAPGQPADQPAMDNLYLAGK
jgi:cytochrome bd ubiquinol oxidase subunit I